MFDEKNCKDKYTRITQILIEKNLQITTMESCTAGQIASLITDTEGSSAIMRGAFITYSNEAKVKCGVHAQIIEKYSVYSEETACAMARAAADAFDTDIAIGITGSFANVDPANADSQPGEIFFAIWVKDGNTGSIHTSHVTDIHGSSRHEDKMIAADHVADVLLMILER